MKTSLYVLLARAAPRAAIIRRGPSKHFQPIYWHTDTDTFYYGQWFKGRIYESRCDLSPSGERLVYFAASHRPPFYSWTAVSRPPYWTAVALWPKGDCWYGGGFFIDDYHIQINHLDHQMKLGEEFGLPKRVVVSPFSASTNLADFEPIDTKRLLHNGWNLLWQRPAIAPPLDRPLRAKEKKLLPFWEKPSPSARRDLNLQYGYLHTHRDGMQSRVVESSHDETPVLSLGQTDWADWDKNGDLLFAKEGQLFRLPSRQFEHKAPLDAAKRLADFRNETFYNLAPPEEAKDWFAPVRRKELYR